MLLRVHNNRLIQRAIEWFCSSTVHINVFAAAIGKMKHQSIILIVVSVTDAVVLYPSV